jgi:hypothetical protein
MYCIFIVGFTVIFRRVKIKCQIQTRHSETQKDLHKEARMADEQREEVKKIRGILKASITRERKSVLRFIAEEDEAKVKDHMDKLMQKFNDFEKASEKYQALLSDELDIVADEEYFDATQDDYVSTLTAGKTWLRSKSPGSTQNTGTDTKRDDDKTAAIAGAMNLLNLPKIDIDVFHGDPMQYHYFVAAFDEVVGKINIDGKTKLARLLQYTAGKAKEAIKHCILIGEGGYDQARQILQTRFGNDFIVTERMISKVRSGKPIHSAEELQTLADNLMSCYETLNQMGRIAEIDSNNCIMDVVSRLQSHSQLRWKRYAIDLKRKKNAYPNFKEFVEFIVLEAEEATDPIYGKIGRDTEFKNPAPRHQSANSKPTSTVSFASNEQQTTRRPIPCIVCKDNHKLLYCDKFKSMRVVDRLKLVSDNRLCELCLMGNHTTANCMKKYTCTVDGCGQRHSKFIHVTRSGRQPAQSASDMEQTVGSPESNVSSNETHYAANASTVTGLAIHLPVVSVKVNDTITVNALLDTASSSSFCTSKLANMLGLDGRKTELNLHTLNGADCRNTTMVDLNVMSEDENNCMRLTNVFVVADIPIQTPSVDLSAYSHLSDITFVKGCQNVDILIGQDHSEALLPLQVRRGEKHEPYAVQTLLGWAINGPVRPVEYVSPTTMSYFVGSVALEKKVDALWDIEHESMDAKDQSFSKNDQEVISLWDNKVQKVDGHYQLPIPWKCDVSIPNNVSVAISRLKSLKTNLIKRNLFNAYDDEISKLLVENHAEIVPVYDVNKVGKVWYLPHHAVISDKKPGKVRIVFDCAAKFAGESLNDKCLQGPDLNNKLLPVLLRFRQYPYAVMSDVQAMYYQVLIPPEDRDALRLLWYDKEGEIIHLRMTKHVFGGVWCAASSTYALRRVVSDSVDPDPVVADAIQRSFYVDDFLRSFSTTSEAETVLHGVKQLLQTGGFNLTKFVTNDADILSSIPVADRAEEVKDFGVNANSKALGVKWCVGEDSFYFDVKTKVTPVATRRDILSTVSSMYDPLGFISPVILIGRLLFQETTRLKLNWDEALPAGIQRKWTSWLEDLLNLKKIHIPRCITRSDTSDMSLELHCFSDASMKAYGCCAYLRAVDRYGHIHTSLLLSKSRVAPIKSITIPRLELLAAVMSAQIGSVLIKELDLQFTECYFWTDSEIVLRYIQNESTRFHVFVSNRLSLIHQLTETRQWHFIPGKQNPADLASRGESAQKLDMNLWFEGPDILKSYKGEWNVKLPKSVIPSDDPEVKRVNDEFCHATKLENTAHPLEKLSTYYSDFHKLKRAVAWLLRLKDTLRRKVKRKSTLTMHEIREAELVVIKHVQQRFYDKEIQALSRDLPVSKASKIKAFSPILDASGALRTGGRLKYANIAESTKHPYIIPAEHPLARMIVLDEHNYAHLGNEWTIAEVRKRFWVTRIRRVVRRVSGSCIKCKRLFANPGCQMMADHLQERLEAYNPPFTFTGLDCFGPFIVKRGRSEVKRYGCIFTCLNTRAVHLEKLQSLDTDSFLNALRRFISRRGTPKKVWSDNGSNFVGAKGELARSMSQIDANKLQNYALKMQFDWHFNPPCASHMGGSWERLIRTVRKVFAGLSDINARLDDDMLETLFCETESIINGRPITKCSNDVNDLSALTPNHLLLLRELPLLAPGKFDDVDLYKRRWRCVQHLAQEFWRRWLREYLPELQKRQKWINKCPNLKVGDLVLILDETTPRGIWPMGLVSQVNESRDGLIRSVRVKTKSSEFVRPVTKVVLLEGKT